MYKNQLGLAEPLHNYIIRHANAEPPLLAQLREETSTHPQARMQISPEQGHLLAMLIRLMGAKRALEVGVFTGYSSLAVVMALPEDGYMVACDISRSFTKTARHYWQQAGVEHKVDLRIAPALATLDQLIQENVEPFDFAFIDADKGNYENYYERTLQLMRTGGLIVVDNTLWSGRVADPTDQDKITRTLRQFNQVVAQDERVDVLMLPIGDGLTLAYKK
ncbi:class I SAM-dependent methyltransferase [filamentous cyanobacterium LEGE 11480]|uniref:Class I SAM-dependent methyltransferase n=1 Tax=Romeriopsis navalis LEGE 11480 TaxID=2777977 RepID=A0A928Z2J6_9CYAN|nr:class I SAM-dependent methyltransferase [Romeriopsis navalis]MBE9028188.1 class I SAM-dependent methyltransferase [Romeriopsis navalis LEGE 11480]